MSSHGKSRSVGFSGKVMVCALALLVVFAVSSVGVLVSYADQKRQVAELEYMREIAASQEAQMADLEERIVELAERIKQAELSEASIRDMLLKEGLSPKGYASDAQVASVTRLSSVSRGSFDRATRTSPERLQESLQKIETMVRTLESQAASVDDRTKQLHGQVQQEVAKLRATPCIWPVKGRITSDFGRRKHPLTRVWENHGGLDIGASYGSKIAAAADGVVTFAAYKYGYGYMVVVDHAFGYQTAYAHCSRLNVKKGQKVVRGQVVGFVGESGIATGPHLHYEVRVWGVQVDPKKFLP